jgi:thiol-disulfide isomerase/thioredoxin
MKYIAVRLFTFHFSLLPFYFCLFTFALLPAACNRAPAPVSVPNSPVTRNSKPQTNLSMPPAKPIGEMAWTALDGKTANLAAFKGKAVILDFWATYCPPCREEIPHLSELQAKYGTDKLQVVGLNVGGDEDRPLIAEFARQYKIAYPLGVPEDALEQFIFSETDVIPQTAIFDRSGVMVKKIVGFSAAIRLELDAAVEQALGSRQ